MKKILFLIQGIVLLAIGMSYGQAKITPDTIRAPNAQPSPGLQWSRNFQNGRPVYYMYDPKLGKSYAMYTGQYANYVFLGKQEASALYQPIGNYLTRETEPLFSTNGVPYIGATQDISLNNHNLYGATIQGENVAVGGGKLNIYAPPTGSGGINFISSDYSNLYSNLFATSAGIFSSSDISVNPGQKFNGPLNGNASTVTNGIYSTGTYNDPSWITGLSQSKVIYSGNSSQYVRGDGSLATFPTLTGYVPYTGATQDLDMGSGHRIYARRYSSTVTGGFNDSFDWQTGAIGTITGSATIPDGALIYSGSYSNLNIGAGGGYGGGSVNKYVNILGYVSGNGYPALRVGNVNGTDATSLTLELSPLGGLTKAGGQLQQAFVTSSILKTDANGKLIAATSGTDYVAPSALSGYVPYIGATTNVDLGAQSLTALSLSVAGAGGSIYGDTGFHFHVGSGGRYIFDYNGQPTFTIRNGGTTTDGAMAANSFVKTGGVSNQYLMADGSTTTIVPNSGSSNSGISALTTSGSGAATLSGNTLNIPTPTLSALGGEPLQNGYGFVKKNGSYISYDNNIYYKSGDSPQFGSASFAAPVNIGTSQGAGLSLGYTPSINWYPGLTVFQLGLQSAIASNNTGNSNNNELTLFHNMYQNPGTGYNNMFDGTSNVLKLTQAGLTFGTGGNNSAGAATYPNPVFTIDQSGNTIAKTFAISGGTSNQYLMADGSVSTGNPNSGNWQPVENQRLSTTNDVTFNSLVLKNGLGINVNAVSPGYMFDIQGKIHTTGITVNTTGYMDKVFNKGYHLRSLEEVNKYIEANHHLPEMPSEKEIVKDGMDLAALNKVLAQKVEELTLYMIKKDKELKAQELRIEKLERKPHVSK